MSMKGPAMSVFLRLLVCSLIVLASADHSVWAQATSAAPVLTNLTDAKAQLWNAGLTVIDGNASVADSDSPNFAGGALIVRVLSGLASDRLSIRNSTVAGQINVAGSDVRLGTTIIGRLINPIPVSGATILRINLRATATPAATTSLLRAITYRNVSNSSVTLLRTVQFKVLDGDGGISLAVNKTIRVGTLNGNYTGTFVGTMNVFGFPQTIPGTIIANGQNTINTTVTNGTAVISLPGMDAEGTGTVTNTGTFSATSAGSISGLGVEVQFAGSVKLNPNNKATGTGTWTIVNTPGITGSGTWTLTRP
jgi:hypothetical protein